MLFILFDILCGALYISTLVQILLYPEKKHVTNVIYNIIKPCTCFMLYIIMNSFSLIQHMADYVLSPLIPIK